MARTHHVKSAQQRYETKPVIDPETGEQKITTVLRRDGTPKLTKKGRPVTRRVTEADKDRPKPNHKCGKCGTEIKVGDPYKWVKVKRTYGGVTYIRCAACPGWRQSELSSSKLSGIYAAQESMADAGGVESIDELSELANTFAEAVREVAEEYRESQTNMVDGFGHDTYVSDELGEKADALDDWANDIESLDFEDFDDADVERDDTHDDEEHEDAVEEAREAHWVDQLELLIDESDNIPV